MIITDRSDPAAPDMNHGAEIISEIGVGEIALFATIQLKTRYVADPIRNPNRAKEDNNFVLPKAIVQSPLH